MHWISLLVCGLLQARLGSAVVVFAGFSNAATQRYISDAVNTMFAEAQNAINIYDAGTRGGTVTDQVAGAMDPIFDRGDWAAWRSRHNRVSQTNLRLTLHRSNAVTNSS